jgi:hypothetical protein
MAVRSVKPAPLPTPPSAARPSNSLPRSAPAIAKAPDTFSDTFSVGPFTFPHVHLPSFLGAPYPEKAQRPAREAEIDAQVAKMGLPAAQQSVLADLKQLGVSSVDVWQGSHVVVKGDGGALYERWKALGAEQRTSSHYHDVPTAQYQLRFGSHGLLFGKDADGNTWFQFENHPDKPFTKDPLDFIEHRLDFVKYKVTGQNVGPFGFSPHAELHDPLQVPWKPLS